MLEAKIESLIDSREKWKLKIQTETDEERIKKFVMLFEYCNKKLKELGIENE